MYLHHVTLQVCTQGSSVHRGRETSMRSSGACGTGRTNNPMRFSHGEQKIPIAIFQIPRKETGGCMSPNYVYSISYDYIQFCKNTDFSWEKRESFFLLYLLSFCQGCSRLIATSALLHSRKRDRDLLSNLPSHHPQRKKKSCVSQPWKSQICGPTDMLPSDRQSWRTMTANKSLCQY